LRFINNTRMHLGASFLVRIKIGTRTICCFCYMYSRFEKLCRACVLCMLWYVSTLNKTLFIYLFIIPHTWLVQLKCAVQKSLHNLQHDEGGNYMAETEKQVWNCTILPFLWYTIYVVELLSQITILENTGIF
jgi:hypothetical protein